MSDREDAANGMNEEAEVGNTSGTNDPTHDEIQRVADYWQKVEALACRHEAIIHTHDSVECSSCGRPVRVLSDVQIEDLKDRARREPLDPADPDSAGNHRTGARRARQVGMGHQLRLRRVRARRRGEHPPSRRCARGPHPNPERERKIEI